MIIFFDSNEYIYHLNKKASLQKIFFIKNLSVCINDPIIREVLRNLEDSQRKEFYGLLFKYDIDFYGQKLPVNLFTKYKELRLKKGDIAIAAFCESIGAEYLVSENRHFLKLRKFDKFKVLSLKEFLNKFK